MGITTEKLDTKEDTVIEDEMENIQNGKFYMGSYSIHWSLDLLSDTITLNVTNRPDLGTKVISKENPVAEFHVEKPVYKKLYAKLSGDFNSKQLSLSGHTTYARPHDVHRIRRYQNVIIVSW